MDHVAVFGAIYGGVVLALVGIILRMVTKQLSNVTESLERVSKNQSEADKAIAVLNNGQHEHNRRIGDIERHQRGMKR